MSGESYPPPIGSGATTPGVHTEPASLYQWENLTQDEINALRKKLIDSILQVIVQWAAGTLLPGPAGQQLGDLFLRLVEIDPLYGALTGDFSLGHTMADLQAAGQDIMSLLGSPSGIGTGSPLLGLVGDIPLFGPLLSDALDITATPVVNALTGTPWFNDLKTALGLTGAGLGTGGLTLPTLDNIPLLGDMLSIADTSVVNALTGTAWFTDLQSLLGDPLHLGTGSPLLPGIPSIPLLNGVADIDTLVTTWGGIGSNFTRTDLANYASLIGNQFVQGLLGGSTIGTTIQNQADAIVQGVYNSSSFINTSFSAVTGSLNAFANMLGFNLSGVPPMDSVGGQAQISSLFISKMPVTRPLTAGIDRSVNAPFDIADAIAVANAVSGGALPTHDVVAAYPSICVIPTVHGGVQKSIRWYGFGTDPIVEFYIRVWKMNTTDATSQMIYATPNLGGVVSRGVAPVWNSYNISNPAGYITTAQDDLLLAEMVITDDGSGTGKYTILALATDTVNRLPGAIPEHLGMYADGYPGVVADRSASGRSTASEKTRTRSIVPLATDNSCLVGVQVNGANGALTGITATIGGVNMGTPLYQSPDLSPGGDFVYNVVFGYIGTAGTGVFDGTSKSIVVTATGLGTGNAGLAISAACYPNVTSWGTPQTATGTGTTPAQTVTGVAPYIFQMITSLSAGFSGYGSEGLSNTAGNTFVDPLLVQTEHGFDGSTYMWADLAASSAWAAVAIPVNATPRIYGNPAAGTNPYYDTVVPWVGLAATPGQSDTAVYDPVTIPIYTSQTMTNPTLQWPWANNFDLVVCGAAAGGDAGNSVTGSWGGNAGSWTGTTFTAAEMGTGDLTWAIGSGGIGGGLIGAGGNSGGDSSVTVPGTGTVTAPGGAGRGSASSTSGNLAGPGVTNNGFDYNDDSFPGALAGQTGQQPGQQPGAGGAGGNAFYSYGQNTYGGRGGDGIGWLVAYQ